MEAREIMSEDPVCCLPSDSIRSVATQMMENSVGLLPVVDNHDAKRLVGVVSDRDIVCRVLAKDGMDCNTATAQDVMTSGKLWTVSPQSSIDDVIDQMEDGQVRRIPVVDESNRVVGIISTADIALEIDEPDEIAEVFEEISEPTNIPHA